MKYMDKAGGAAKKLRKKHPAAVFAILLLIFAILALICFRALERHSDRRYKDLRFGWMGEYSMSDNGQTDCGKALAEEKNPISGSTLFSRRIRVPILMYHYIESPQDSKLLGLYHDPSIFEAQLKGLSDGCYITVFVHDIGRALSGKEKLPPHPIALTFDDGYESMYTNAFPLLKKYNMKGTMYVIVDNLDTPGYLTSAQAKEMAESGFVEIASHTLHHVELRKASYQTAVTELNESKTKLEGIIGQPVYSFAYPFGLFTSRDEYLCKMAGYETCASTYPGQVQTWNKRFSLYRYRPSFRSGSALELWLKSAGPKK